ncbi:hypothetical protein BDF20DRAFT_612251 [Mycotypha africana]|uniref:uncharacterized protein n=1 Tax=Mycotypha africana TaxID=64632 RepID=UPI00230068AB|nr:uncharacterized protein BDF20DRAFT_612251 [Mycotypha africana]KAI8975517.1 hypothetical protein BDF20DRAFT_612251 [Mycotypha africana]
MAKEEYDRTAFSKRIKKKKKKKKKKVPEEKKEDEARDLDEIIAKKDSNSVKNKWKPDPFSVGNIRKVPLIVFGSSMFGKSAVPIKGHKTGAVGVLWGVLKRREAVGDCSY